MKTDAEFQEWHRLFVAKADGTISPEDHERLSTLLKSSAEARREWFAFHDAEAALLAWAQRAEVQHEHGPALLEMEESQKTLSLVQNRRPAAWAAAAAIALAATAWLVWSSSARRLSPETVSRDEATTSSVAVLARGVDMEWDAPAAAPSVNAPLSPGLLRLRRGVAEIEFFNGARLCIEGPAELRLLSSSKAFCQSGRFTAHVPPAARGFCLKTPKGDIVDLGTDFGLALNDTAPEVHVFKGEVEVHRPKVATQTLTTGAAIRLASASPAPTLTANVAAFVTSHDLDSRVSESQRAAFASWQSAEAAWNVEPSLRLRFDFQDALGVRSLKNSAQHGQEIAPASIVGCTWTEGRWPGKQALQFRSLSDRVRLQVPGEYRDVTLSAWVQLHALNIRQSAICMSQGIDPGYVHWQVLHDGSLCLGVGDLSQKNTTDFISPVVFTPERFGQWVHLAVVYDAGAAEVRMYVDGRRISRQPIVRPLLLRPGTAELGNWTPSPEKRQQPVRNFIGCMDEFRFYARAMSDDEIRQMAR